MAHAKAPSSRSMVRDATLADVDALLDLEQACFDQDRLSARSFKRFLKGSKALLRVATTPSARILGYILVLFHPNTALARLYSLAIHPECRGRGLAAQLLADAEVQALERGATRMRLEVRKDNVEALRLYHARGFREFDVHVGYYEDAADAIRMEKLLAPHLEMELNRVAYYPQTLGFTCGPAALMMAMHTQDTSVELNRALELDLWREATTIFMTSGHGGCGALGLALAAWRRGFRVEAALSDETELFIDSVRDPVKKDVIRLAEQQFWTEAERVGIPTRNKPYTPAELCQLLSQGAIPLALISLYRLTGDKAPHWVTIAACDEKFLYLNDPYTEVENERFDTDCIGIPVRADELARMMRLGRRKHFATVIVHPRSGASKRAPNASKE